MSWTAQEWFLRYPELARTPVFTLRVALGFGRYLTIRAYEGPVQSPYGHTTLYCEGRVAGCVLFQRDAFYVGIPAGQSIDGDLAKELVLSLFAMKPGDTDNEFFSHYTEEQLAFVEEHGEWLSLCASERYGEF